MMAFLLVPILSECNAFSFVSEVMFAARGWAGWGNRVLLDDRFLCSIFPGILILLSSVCYVSFFQNLF